MNLTAKVVVFAKVKFLIVLMFDVLCFLYDVLGLILRHFLVNLNDADLMEIATAFYDWNFLYRSVHYYVIMASQNNVDISGSLC